MQEEEEAQKVDEPTEEPAVEPTEEPEDEPAPEPAATEPRQPTDEMKIVINKKADRFMLGVQSPECDPVYTTMEGTLAEALEKVPALVTEAKLKWEAAPRYPKAVLPEPAPIATPARTPIASQPAKPKVQPSFF